MWSGLRGGSVCVWGGGDGCVVYVCVCGGGGGVVYVCAAGGCNVWGEGV